MQIQSNGGERFVGFSGAHNFRDIGGYKALDGRLVAGKLVYRSGSLARLTEEDIEIFSGLGIQFVCDLRGNAERRHRPSRLPTDTAIEIWCRDHEVSVGNMLQAMSGPGATPENSRGIMMELYRSMTHEHAESYAELFRRLAGGALPLLFHCTAGKDRTGVAAALLLDWLGVSRADIIEDYALTDLFFTKGVEIIMQDFGDQLPPDSATRWAPLMRADEAYLTAMFRAVEAAYGSVEGYLRGPLQLDGQILAQVREHLLVQLKPAQGPDRRWRRP